jgi:hypothetical protein
MPAESKSEPEALQFKIRGMDCAEEVTAPRLASHLRRAASAGEDLWQDMPPRRAAEAAES